MKTKWMKRMLSVLAVAVTGSMLVCACGNGGGTQESGSAGDTESKDKPTVTLMIDVSGYVPLNTAVKMVQEKFPEYNIVSKQWEYGEVKTAVKTTFASGGSGIDIAFSDARLLQTYLEADLLLDLTDYVEADEDWKNSFNENALSAATYDGKIYGLPWQTAYPVLIANNELLDQIGIEVTDNMSYDEWMEICQKIQDAGYFAFANGEQQGWILRQAYLNAFDDVKDLEAFCKGEIPFTDDRIKSAYERASSIYTKNYCYPGDGAIASSVDEGLAGFAGKEAVFYGTTNSSVATTVESSGITDYTILSYPTFSNSDTNYLLGAPDCYFVPANTENAEATIEVLKYLTSDEVMQAMTDAGTVVCNMNVTSEDPNYADYSKDMGRVYVNDPSQLSDELATSLEASLAEYIYNGEPSLANMDKLLEEAADK